MIYNYENELVEELEEPNKMSYQTEFGLARLGIKIYLSYSRFDKYYLTSFNSKDTMLFIDLCNSTILYDRNGNLTELREKQKEKLETYSNEANYEYHNLKTLEPLLDIKSINNKKG